MGDFFPFLLLLLLPIFSLLFILNLPPPVSAVDTITTADSIRDGDTIVSAGGIFELGFFTPGSSPNRYVGIWYKKVSNRTVVWVANRHAPLPDKSGVLKVISPGILALYNRTNGVVWSTNTSRPVNSPIAKLLDSGNLVVKDDSSGAVTDEDEYLWESYDYPTDTLLPTMKLGRNFAKGIEMYLSSWKSRDDPAPGEYSYHCDITGYPQDLMRKGSAVVYRAGPWNGLRWSGAPNMKNNTVTSFGLVYTKKEVYYSFDLVDKSVVSLLVLTPDGDAQRTVWIERTQSWVNYHSADVDDCDSYKLCGAYATCNIGKSPVCGCLDKFVPRSQSEWDTQDWYAGCVRRKPLDCEGGDGFVKYSGIKLPDTRYSWFNETMTLDQCKTVCSRNCSCMAYTNLDIRNGGSGCLTWSGDLVDIRDLPSDGQDIYIRMASSEVASMDASNGKTNKKIVVILPIAIGIVFFSLTLVLFIAKRRNDQRLKRKGMPADSYSRDYTNETRNDDMELPLFDLSTIAKATNNFSTANKIGEGGFGPVHKGVLEDGLEIAVKRLSETSTQGLREFKNEVICFAKLQHRNLVRLLGCCIQGEEKMLIYEYMPNKSLNSFIFDETKSRPLDWPQRFQIINGTARGLMYLHQDSRLRIIHRDLKASNILLDAEMNPKISDFGIARTFGGNETEANTRRVVGTYGYMAPEYAVDGLFSVKSDVFSFGVLVLEIVSGKRNRGFNHPDHNLNLLGHAWKLHQEGRSLEIVDAQLADSCHISELLRSIHVGLLCVQQSPEDRPNMSSVIFMLTNQGTLPQPKEPGFFTSRNVTETEYSSSSFTPNSVNEITITLLDAR